MSSIINLLMGGLLGQNGPAPTSPVTPPFMGGSPSPAPAPQAGGGILPTQPAAQPAQQEPDPDAIYGNALKTLTQESPANNILLGMLQKGIQPEDMTKGSVARNALANFARGALMGPNFRPVQDDIRARKEKEYELKLRTVQAQVAEDKAAKLAALNLVNQHRLAAQAATVNEQKQLKLDLDTKKILGDLGIKRRQEDRKDTVLNQVTIPGSNATIDLKKSQATNKDAATEWQLMVNANPALKQNVQKEVFGILTNPDATDEERKSAVDALDQINKSARLSKNPPGGVHTLTGYASPEGTVPVIDKNGKTSLVPLPDGTFKNAPAGSQQRLTSAVGAYGSLKEAADLAQNMSPAELGLAHELMIKPSADWQKIRNNPKVYAYLQSLHAAGEQIGGAHGWRNVQGVETLYNNLKTVRSPVMVQAAILPYMHSMLGIAKATPDSEATLYRAGITPKEIDDLLSSSISQQVTNLATMQKLVSGSAGRKSAPVPTTHAPAPKEAPAKTAPKIKIISVENVK